MRGHHKFHPLGPFAPQVYHCFGGLHLKPCAGKFKPAWADARHQPADDWPHPVGHPPQWQSARRAFDIGDEAFDSTATLACAAEWFGLELIAKQCRQFLTARVADDQPLIALPSHIADGDVGEHVGIINACPAGEREEIGRKL